MLPEPSFLQGDFGTLRNFLTCVYNEDVWDDFDNHEDIWTDFLDDERRLSGEGFLYVVRLVEQMNHWLQKPVSDVHDLVRTGSHALYFENPQDSVRWMTQCRDYMQAWLDRVAAAGGGSGGGGGKP